MMLLMIADELDATGAAAMSWFHGLSDGKSCWPRSVRSARASSGSTTGNARRLGARRADRTGKGERRMVLGMADPSEAPRRPHPSGPGAGRTRARPGMRQGATGGGVMRRKVADQFKD